MRDPLTAAAPSGARKPTTDVLTLIAAVLTAGLTLAGCDFQASRVAPAEPGAAASAPSGGSEAVRELSLLHWNVEFLWDGVAPEDGEADLDFAWRGSPEKAEAHMEEIAETLRRVDADLVNLTEVEGPDALDLFNRRHLAGHGYRPYLVEGTDTATGQDVALLSRHELLSFGRDTRRGRSGTTRKGVSKHYVGTLDLDTVAGRKRLGLVGLHLLAGPTRSNRKGPREAQADAIRGMAAELAGQGRSMVVWGDFNDFDGSVDDAKASRPITRVLEWVRGLDPERDDDDLVNVMGRAPQRDRYTSRGRYRNAIDHVLLSPDLADAVTSVEFLHDAPGSGHSPILVRLRF
ncbi:MAG: endonuclease/exonuclease/phosphatase family protein [Acidobacteriota bacterium]